MEGAGGEAVDGQWALPADFLNKSKIEKEKLNCSQFAQFNAL